MQVTPTATPAAATATKPAIGAVRSSIADGLREAGDGYAKATDLVGVASDKTWIHPTEAVYSAGEALQKGTKKLGFFNKVAGALKTGGGFVTAYYGMVIGGMLRSPGDLAKDLTYGAADAIDGQRTRTGDFGFGFPGQAAKADAELGAAGSTQVSTQLISE